MPKHPHEEICDKLIARIRNNQLTDNEKVSMQNTIYFYLLGFTFEPRTQIFKMHITPRNDPGFILTVPMLSEATLRMAKAQIDLAVEELDLMKAQIEDIKAKDIGDCVLTNAQAKAKMRLN